MNFTLKELKELHQKKRTKRISDNDLKNVESFINIEYDNLKSSWNPFENREVAEKYYWACLIQDKFDGFFKYGDPVIVKKYKDKEEEAADDAMAVFYKNWPQYSIDVILIGSYEEEKEWIKIRQYGASFDRVGKIPFAQFKPQYTKEDLKELETIKHSDL